MTANSGAQASAPVAQPSDRLKKLGGLRKMISDGAIELSLRVIAEHLKSSPKDSDFWVLKAQAHQAQGKFDDAYAAMEKAAEYRPGAAELRMELARLANARHNQADEIKALHAVAALGALPDRLFVRLVDLHAGRQEWAEALAVADKLVAAKPEQEQFILKRAGVLGDAGRLAEARAYLEKFIDTGKASDHAVTVWAVLVAERMGDLDSVAARLQTLADSGNATWPIYACLGKALSRQDRVQEAISVFRRATELAPEQAGNWYDKGVLERQVGLLEEAQASMNRSLELDAANPGALRVAGYEHKYEYGDPAFKRVNVALAKVAGRPKHEQVEIHYAVAKALEDVGETDAAFAHYAEAGRLQKEITPWSDVRMRGVLALIKNYLRPEDYAAVRAQGLKTDKPVFVFGMPRSGTTLLEQVIASHPQAYGAGELKLGAGVLNGIQIGRATLETSYDGTIGGLANCQTMSVAERGRKYLDVVEGIAGPGPARIVDKMPGNYNWVGLLDAVMPGCHLIHSRRHPVEICLSQYRLFFPDGINFSYDLRDLGKAYRLYYDYMQHWSALLGDRILHVRYEDMVADLDTEARRIIAYIGLPWDDACLRFYENERKVVTASVSQVRKPIYTSSVNRWRKYEKYLQPLLQELGPLVAEYEEELAQADAKRQAAAQ